MAATREEIDLRILRATEAKVAYMMACHGYGKIRRQAEHRIDGWPCSAGYPDGPQLDAARADLDDARRAFLAHNNRLGAVDAGVASVLDMQTRDGREQAKWLGAAEADHERRMSTAYGFDAGSAVCDLEMEACPS